MFFDNCILIHFAKLAYFMQYVLNKPHMVEPGSQILSILGVGSHKILQIFDKIIRVRH